MRQDHTSRNMMLYDDHEIQFLLIKQKSEEKIKFDKNDIIQVNEWSNKNKTSAWYLHDKMNISLHNYIKNEEDEKITHKN